MARIIQNTTEETTIVTSTRTWRAQFFTDLNLAGNYVIEFFREKVQKVGDGPTLQTGEQTTHRRTMSQLASMKVELHDGTVLTGAQVAEAVSIISDLTEEEDELAAIPPPVPSPAPEPEAEV